MNTWDFWFPIIIGIAVAAFFFFLGIFYKRKKFITYDIVDVKKIKSENIDGVFVTSFMEESDSAQLDGVGVAFTIRFRNKEEDVKKSSLTIKHKEGIIFKDVKVKEQKNGTGAGYKLEKNGDIIINWELFKKNTSIYITVYSIVLNEEENSWDQLVDFDIHVYGVDGLKKGLKVEDKSESERSVLRTFLMLSLMFILLLLVGDIITDYNNLIYDVSVDTRNAKTVIPDELRFYDGEVYISHYEKEFRLINDSVLIVIEDDLFENNVRMKGVRYSLVDKKSLIHYYLKHYHNTKVVILVILYVIYVFASFVAMLLQLLWVLVFLGSKLKENRIISEFEKIRNNSDK